MNESSSPAVVCSCSYQFSSAFWKRNIHCKQFIDVSLSFILSFPPKFVILFNCIFVTNNLAFCLWTNHMPKHLYNVYMHTQKPVYIDPIKHKLTKSEEIVQAHVLVLEVKKLWQCWICVYVCVSIICAVMSHFCPFATEGWNWNCGAYSSRDIKKGTISTKHTI